ncbi:hypothetical protein JHK82_053120 [Glycine max]|uniref:RNA polymerase II transcriptional coactivator KIWI n=1 Tax=Glycine soja TaxID=3848 RepID=A0A0B2Q0H3_GLYSO|nr:hypothetical protein JHK86_052965 [Glycine max]KAG4927338.1 hypothetical protein JHK85_053824 [Glycine max]KAG5082954.1 hypothetical protein JHK84_052992 [Glycine max]KAG5085723.1 hypothetical protein JHK82_053120 [Glycine max]KHN13499.1 RNA polymerase II transcriptional coactivator KIWI [Glycine soja]
MVAQLQIGGQFRCLWRKSRRWYKIGIISNNKRVSVRKWKGNIMVDIHEFYIKDGKQLAGRKELLSTISFHIQQRFMFIEVEEQPEVLLKEKAEKKWLDRSASTMELVKENYDSEEEQVNKHKQMKTSSKQLKKLQEV